MADPPVVDLEFLAPESTLEEPLTAPRVAYGPVASLDTNGQSRYLLPTGTSRCVEIEDLVQNPLYVNFGASNVVANPGSGMVLNYGKQQFMVPDSSTHMALHTDDGHQVVVKIGWAEK